MLRAGFRVWVLWQNIQKYGVTVWMCQLRGLHVINIENKKRSFTNDIEVKTLCAARSTYTCGINATRNRVVAPVSGATAKSSVACVCVCVFVGAGIRAAGYTAGALNKRVNNGDFRNMAPLR